MQHKPGGIAIYYCGREACHPGHFFGPAIRRHYLLHVILKGRGIFRAKGAEYKVSAAEAFLIRPDEVTYYEADGVQPWEYAWVAFSGPEGERLLSECGLAKNCIGRFHENGPWARWSLCLADSFGSGENSQNEMTGYLYLLFSQMIRSEKPSGDYTAEYMEKAESYIQHNYSYSVTVGDIARYVGIQRTYLYKLFMKYKNVSPKKYLTACRLNNAKWLLESTSLTVTEIALSSGFHDASSFCKIFQEMEQMTPLHYRKQLNENQF